MIEWRVKLSKFDDETITKVYPAYLLLTISFMAYDMLVNEFSNGSIQEFHDNLPEEGYDTIPLPSLTLEQLDIIMEFAQRYNDNDTLRQYLNLSVEEKRKLPLDDEDSRFFDELGKKTVFPLLIAANYLDSEILMSRVAKWIGKEILKLTTVQLAKEFFESDHDLTPDEIQQVKLDFPWLENSNCHPTDASSSVE